MTAKLEIYNEDGSIRFSSDLFTPIKYAGTFKMGTISPNGSTKGNHTKWFFKLNLNIPPISQDKIVMLTPLGVVWQPHPSGTVTSGLICEKTYPTAVNWSYVVADMQRDCFILEV